MSDKERIAGLIKTLNEIADYAEGRRMFELFDTATGAVRLYGSPVDCQRGLFADMVTL